MKIFSSVLLIVFLTSVIALLFLPVQIGPYSQSNPKFETIYKPYLQGGAGNFQPSLNPYSLKANLIGLSLAQKKRP